MKCVAGQKRNRLTAVRFVERRYSASGNYREMWIFTCDCDPTKEVELSLRDVLIGRTKSCGCYRKEVTRNRHLKHGDGTTGRSARIWRIFRGIIQRCNDPNAKIYKYYGARGIRCLWACYEDFKRDMLPTYADHLTIGRIDNNGHYCKENCRWETRAQQARNYSRNVVLEFNGKSQPMCDWAAELNIPYPVLSARIRTLKWDTAKALTTPVKSRKGAL
jgi:hypothetical protein